MHKKQNILLWLMLVLMGLSGCGTGSVSQNSLLAGDQSKEKKGMATLSVFLHLDDSQGKPLWMRLDSIEITGEEGNHFLQADPVEVQSNKIEQGQLFLGRQSVPIGRYQGLSFSIAKAALLVKGQKTMLALDTPNIDLKLTGDLYLRQGDSLSLFVTWDTTQSLMGTALFSPALTATIQDIPLATDLAYISCPDIDTLYVIRTDLNRVCGSLGIAGRPSSLSVHPAQNRLFVLSRKQATIKVIELSSNRLVDEIKIPMMLKPDKMVTSPDGEWAYVIESRRDLMVRVDLDKGGLSGHTTLSGKRPHFLTYLADQKMLAVSAEHSQKITLLDPVTLNETYYIGVGNGAEGVLQFNNSLYVAERKTNTISAYLLPSGVKQGRLTVGSGPVRLASAENGWYIFATSHDAGEIAIIRPGQYNVIKEIDVGGAPRNMAFDGQRKWLYVTDEKEGGIIVIDLSTLRVVHRISLGAIPDELVTLK
jgi:DNA-binding beta-propeller fold protein YncE